MNSPVGAGTVLITGASSGLGEEMARQFATLGYDLALCARRTERLETLAEEIWSATGRRVETATLDVTDHDAVFAVFHEFAHKAGSIERIVVNAGVSGGVALGTGGSAANRTMAMTNFVGALGQTEAALEIFRRQGRGHLVLISSMSALRGMRESRTTYAATKAGLASIAEGLRSERIEGVEVSVIYPGYIRSEMNSQTDLKRPFMVDTEPGVRAMVKAIEKRRARAYVPAWPWAPLGAVVKVLPLWAMRKLA